MRAYNHLRDIKDHCLLLIKRIKNQRDISDLIFMNENYLDKYIGATEDMMMTVYDALIMSTEEKDNYFNAIAEIKSDIIKLIDIHLLEIPNRDLNNHLNVIMAVVDSFSSHGYKSQKEWDEIFEKGYLEVNGKKIDVSSHQDFNDSKELTKQSAKYFAFYHWLLVATGKELQFEKDANDKWPKKIMISYFKERYPDSSSQSLYKEYTDLDTTNTIAIANRLGRGYKEIIRKISNNNTDILAYLKRYPDK